MTTWPSQNDHAALVAMFGNPDANGDGAPDPAWVHEHLTTIAPPYQLYYGTAPVKRITCNRAIAEPLFACFSDILKHYGSAAEVRRHNMDAYSGCYNFRPKRAGHSLSMHAYGIAIDLDAIHNPFQRPGGAMPVEAVAIFKAHGAVWGGDFSPKYHDPMHFQWATV